MLDFIKRLLGGDFTPLEHGAVALLIQFITLGISYLLFGFIPAVIALSALPGSFCFFGREHAQAEMRIKSARKSKELSWDITIEAMKFWKWDYPSFMDFVVPVVCNVLVSTLLLAVHLIMM